MKSCDPKLLQLSRELRRDATEAEKKLWAHLRGRRLAGLRFKRQCPMGPYILDFYCPEHRLVIEVDGSGHMEPEQVLHDSRRSAFLTSQGLMTMRFWNHEVLENTAEVLNSILVATGL